MEHVYNLGIQFFNLFDIELEFKGHMWVKWDPIGMS